MRLNLQAPNEEPDLTEHNRLTSIRYSGFAAPIVIEKDRDRSLLVRRQSVARFRVRIAVVNGVLGGSILVSEDQAISRLSFGVPCSNRY